MNDGRLYLQIQQLLNLPGNQLQVVAHIDRTKPEEELQALKKIIDSGASRP
jgi:hypothetical protein